MAIRVWLLPSCIIALTFVIVSGTPAVVVTFTKQKILPAKLVEPTLYILNTLTKLVVNDAGVCPVNVMV